MDAQMKVRLIAVLACLTGFFLAASPACAQSGARPLDYENEALGIKMSGPSGWSATPGDKAQEAMSQSVAEMTSLESIKEAVARTGVLVVYTKFPFGSPLEYNPNITLVSEPNNASYNIASNLDAANATILTLRSMFKDVRLIADPDVQKIGDLETGHFVYEGTIVRGYLETRIRSSVYIFMRADLIYTLSMTAKADEYEANSSDFAVAAASLTVK